MWYHLVGGSFVGTTLTQNDYTYSTAGMRLTNQVQMQGWTTRTETYGYDELYRLTSVNYGDTHTQSYTFDAMGNRASKVNDGVSEGYSYNNANMLLTRGTNNYANDLDGNTLTGGGRTNTWDSQNRLVNCVNGANTSNFTYASDGIRHRSVLGANTTDFVLDASMFVREKLNGAVSATYLAGLRGPEYRRDDGASTVRWYCFDGLGSVLGEVDPSGNLTASRSYDVYGAVRTSAGTSTSKHKFVGNLGHPSEDETGLIYMRARHMDPACGRFINEDPGHHGPNLFTYCGNNPASAVDPSGKIPEWIITAIAYILEWFEGDGAWELLLDTITKKTSRLLAILIMQDAIYVLERQAAGHYATAVDLLGIASGLSGEAAEWWKAAAGRQEALAGAKELAIIALRELIAWLENNPDDAPPVQWMQ